LKTSTHERSSEKWTGNNKDAVMQNFAILTPAPAKRSGLRRKARREERRQAARECGRSHGGDTKSLAKGAFGIKNGQRRQKGVVEKETRREQRHL